MNDIALINRAINNVMNKYITDNGYSDSVVFSSRVIFAAGDVMFTMMMKQGLLQVKPFKAVFPADFLMGCDEDEVVVMICDMFKKVIEQCEKMQDKEEQKQDIDSRNSMELTK